MGISQRFLDLLFPPKCPLCGEILEGPLQQAPCPKCREARFWLPPDQVSVPGKSFFRCVSVGWYQDELKESVRRFKFRDRPTYAAAYGPLLAQAIARELRGEYDVLSWVPVSPETLKKRGYDQARLLAEEAGKLLGHKPVATLEKTGKNSPQSSLADGSKRRSNVAGVYSVPHQERVVGRRILLVDDILTTGATLEEAAETLRRAGAARVVAATLCRTPNREPAERRVVLG